MKKNKISLLFLYMMAAFIIVLSGCKKDKGADPIDDNDDPNDTLVAEANEIDQFIWYNMNLYYLWYRNVPDLADNRFLKTSDLWAFLNNYHADHDALFEDLLYQPDVIDKWSWIVDDYVALENSFQGITLSMGFEYGLVRYSTDLVLGYVQYVVPGTPADNAGIKRGDIFTKIDSQQLNLSNYSSLLFGRDAFEIGFADIVNNTVIPNSRTVSLIAVEVHENPIHYTKIFEQGGKKIGYMVYNAFTSSYNNAMNDAFGEFKNAGVQELILDFRYNGGGSILTSTYLASMIYGTYTNQIYCVTQYNDKLDEYFRNKYGAEYFNDRFESTIAGQDGAANVPINSLNLNRVYIITTSGSASASELVINGLKPYIDVVLVGENTHGKYVGSFTIKDYDDFGNLNPNHKWALQPITLKIANSLGVSDYVDGFAPNFYAEEDIANLLPFGDENEPMLKAALDAIAGVAQFKTYEPRMHYEKVADSKDLVPHKKEMYYEGNLLKIEK